MKADFVNTFIKAGVDVFGGLINEAVTRGKPTKSSCLFPHFNMAAVIKVFGSVNGFVIYSMDSHLANRLASDLLCGMPIPNHSLLIKSSISEICNMICGKAVTIINDHYKYEGIEISVPIFLDDANNKIYKQNLISLNVPLMTSYGVVALSLGFE